MSILGYDGSIRLRRSNAKFIVFGIVVLTVAVVLIWLYATDPERRGRTAAAERMKCSGNMRMIGIALRSYADRNNQQFPDSLSQIAFTEEDQLYDWGALHCPSDHSMQSGRDRKVIVEQLDAGRYGNYVYLGSGLTTKGGHSDVVLYEPLSNHNGMMCVLFADGNVEFLSAKESAKFTLPRR